MPRGVIGPPGPALYPTCGSPGRGGIEKHYRQGTASCELCRRQHARDANKYKMRRREHGRMTVDATGTRRRVQALMTVGWRGADLAPLIGTDHTTVARLTQVDRVWLTTETRVRRVYERIGMTPGTSPTTRKRALAKGWLPPAAWDDELIGDPQHVPLEIVLRDWDEALVHQRRLLDQQRRSRARAAAAA